MKLRVKLLSILLTLLCLTPLKLRAAEPPITIEVTGEAVGSDLEAPRELFERAKADAQRIAVEQAIGTFVKSHTVVSNGQLAEDLTHARVRGKIEKMEVLSQERGTNDPNHYRVTIRATIAPVVADKTEGIAILAALSRTVLKEGDDVTLQYRVSRDSHVYIFVIGADNSVTQLLPNSEIPKNLVRAGKAYHFPPADSTVHLTSQLLPEFKKSGAEEKIKIIATKKEEPLLHGGFKEGFKVFDAKSTGLVSDLLRRLAQLEPADWGEMTLVYRIAPEK
jgi:hypothetical protein